MKKESPVKKDLIKRAWIIYALFFVLGLAIVLKIIYIQYGPESAELKKKAEGPRTFRTDIIGAERGDIYSYDGRLLATSLPMYDLKMDFRATGLTDSIFKTSLDSLSKRMADFFKDKSAAQYKNMFQDYRKKTLSGQQRVFRISPRNVSYFELTQINEFPLFRKRSSNISGFIPEKITQRVLPYGSIASRTIGRKVNDSLKWGIEGAFDEYLKGEDGITKMQRISGSFWMPISDASNKEPLDGIDIISTIDIELQDVAERALKEQLQAQGADWGTAILMEVKTGEIRAMANLTRRSNGECVEDLNHAISQRINPGSTFKLAVLMVLLEDAKMSLDDIIDIAGGDVMMYGKRVRDSHLGYDKLTLKEVFEVSSNVGFARAVNDKYRSNQQRFVDQLIKTGVNDTIPFQLEGYRGPYIHTDAKKWSGLTLTSMSYGYELEMTPLQTLVLYNAVANNGKMISPIIVKELSRYGQTIRTFRSTVLRDQICSSSTLKKVKEALEGVATDGTAQRLRVEDLEIAVKTGTAQMPNNNRGYGTQGGMDYLATIVGYFPADNPQYTCIVAMKTFRGGGRGANYYGGSLAGPVFKVIAERVYGNSVDWRNPVTSKDKSDDIPSVKNGDIKSVNTVLSDLSLPYDQKRGIRGNVVVSTDSTGIKVDTVGMSSSVVPDVKNYGLKDAVNLLENLGMNVTFTGKGKVVRQSVSPGTALRNDLKIHLTLN
ncbi:MAG: transpeptidase family protein [Rikenellaceae bacterium]|nr:transpeptidase family protein [Rikenellaceae bacterium]